MSLAGEPRAVGLDVQAVAGVLWRSALALVRDLRDHRTPVSEEDLADVETDVLAGFVPARA